MKKKEYNKIYICHQALNNIYCSYKEDGRIGEAEVEEGKSEAV